MWHGYQCFYLHHLHFIHSRGEYGRLSYFLSPQRYDNGNYDYDIISFRNSTITPISSVEKTISSLDMMQS
jgi:hypothetical protein